MLLVFKTLRSDVVKFGSSDSVPAASVLHLYMDAAGDSSFCTKHLQRGWPGIRNKMTASSDLRL